MEKITLKMRDGICEAYEFKNPGPGVLLLMDAIGVRDVILDIAQDIAKEGFHVLVPNLFYRDHNLPLIDYPEHFTKEELGAFFPKIRPMMGHLTPEKMMEDAEVYLDHFKGPIGIVGYCMGGRLGIVTAAKFSDKVKSVVSLHAGGLVSDDPWAPINLLKDVKARLFLGHADHDQHMNSEQIKTLEAELKRFGKDFTSVVYKDAHHGYSQKDLPAYQEKAYGESLKATVEEFRRNL